MPASLFSVLSLAMLLVAPLQVAGFAHSLASLTTIQTQAGDLQQARSVLGIELRSAGKTVGRIVDMLARPDGSIAAAVVEYGGFLGIGARKVAIPWRELHLERDGQQLVAITDLTPDQLRTIPEYRPEAVAPH